MSSHAVKYRCTHKELEGDSGETTFIIEILQDGFGGSVTDVRGLGDVFRLSYDKIDARNPTENPIQKGRLEFSLAVESSTDLDILEEFLASDEEEYQMRLKKDGNVLWTGYVLGDLLQYSEGDYPFRGSIVAKDLSRLSGIDFPLTNDRVTLIDTLADFLDDLGLGLDIYTYTSWTEQNTDGAVAGDYDFLNRIYNDRKAFRRFARTGDESDEKITLEEALERFLRNYGLILRQEENAWRLYQITALDDPTDVFEAVYNSSGTQQSTSSVDLTVSIDRVNRYLLPASLNEINPGIKRVRNKYDHRTAVSNIAFPELVTLDSGNTSEDQEQLIISDGDQRLALAGDIQADIPTGESNGRVQWRITIVTSSQTYYWDHNNTTWTNTTTINETDLTFVGPGAQTASSDLWIGSLDIETDNLPTDADGTMTVSLLRALSDSSFANETRWENVVFAIKNPVASENSDSIDYQLTQSGGFSTNFEVQDTWFGDGPNAYSPGALRHGSDDGDFTSDDWQRRGTTSGYRNLHENLLKEIIDTQRGPRRNLQADLWGNYSSANVVSYDSKYFFFIGGDLTGRNVWNAQLLEVNIATGTDDFEDLPKFTDETGSGTGSSGGGSSGGLDQSTADARYFKQASLLSEASDLPTLRGNIGLADGSADLDLNSLDINGSAFVDSSRNLTALKGTFGGDDGGNDSRSFNVISDTAVARIWRKHVSNDPAIELIESDFGVDTANHYWDAYLSKAGVFTIRQRFDAGSQVDIDQFWIDADGDAFLQNTLTINSQLLFTAGNEQLLSTDASPTFAGLTTPGALEFSDTADGSRIIFSSASGSTRFRMLNDGLWITPADGTELRIGPSSGADTFSMLINRITEFRTTATENIFDNAVAIGTTSLTSGSVLTVNGDADFKENLFVEGGLFVKEFTVDTTRVLLSHRFGSGGIIGEIVDSTVGSEQIKFVDQDGNEIVPFADNDLLLIQQRTGVNSGTIVKRIKRKVVADSQPSNVVSLTTSGATTGTDVGTIAVGDQAVLDGNTTNTDRDGFIGVDVLDMPIGAFKFYDGVTDFGGGTEIMRVGGMDPGGSFEYDSSLTGDVGIAGKIGGSLAFALTEDEGLVGGSNFDADKQWSTNNNETFKGGGVLLDWTNERQSVGNNIGFDSAGTGYPDEIVVSTTTDSSEALYAHPTDPAQASRNILDTTVSQGEVIRFKFSYEVSDNNLNGTWSWQWKIESFDGSTWIDPFATIDPVNAYLSGSTSFTEVNSFTFERESTAASENRVFYVYFYPPDDTLRHRLVVDWTDDQDFTDSNGIAKSVEIQSRVYRPSIEINQGGVYVVDTDIHKSRVTGLGIKKEELGVGDIVG